MYTPNTIYSCIWDLRTNENVLDLDPRDTDSSELIYCFIEALVAEGLFVIALVMDRNVLVYELDLSQDPVSLASNSY